MAPCAAIRFQSHKTPFEPLVFPWLMPSLFQRWLFRAKQVLSCQTRLSCFHPPRVLPCVLLPLTRFWVAWIPGHADITASDLCITKLFLVRRKRGEERCGKELFYSHVSPSQQKKFHELISEGCGERAGGMLPAPG